MPDQSYAQILAEHVPVHAGDGSTVYCSCRLAEFADPRTFAREWAQHALVALADRLPEKTGFAALDAADMEEIEPIPGFDRYNSSSWKLLAEEAAKLRWVAAEENTEANLGPFLTNDPSWRRNTRNVWRK